MKKFIRIFFTLFFIIAIGTHIYLIIYPDGQSIAWHCLYFITYGICGRMLFSNNTNAAIIYLIAALFPFATHAYGGYQHLIHKDGNYPMIIVCIVVCLLLLAGFLWIRKVTADSK